MVDYTPASAVAAGDVVVLNSILPLIAPVAIAANAKGTLAAEGIWKVPQKAEVFTAGDAVYWDADGDPYGGTAGSGAATATASAGPLMGRCVETTTATDTYVKVKLTASRGSTTVAGSVTADDITGSDTSLTITGKQGTAEAAGGTLTLAAGAGGATTGAGGAASLAGGAATANNCAGGALSLDGGNGHGTGADGAITIGTNNAASITLGKMPRVPVNSNVAVGGTAIGNANAVLEGLTIVTGADDTAAVILPTAVAGMEVEIISTAAGKNLIVFPAVGAAINALGANNAFNSATDAPHLKFRATSATQWYCMSDTAG